MRFTKLSLIGKLLHSSGDAKILPIESTSFVDNDKVPEWLHPYTTFRNTWDVAVFIIVSYNCFFSPVQIMISYDVCDYSSFQFWFDMACDILFWVDTGLNFYFPFVDPETKAVVNNKKAIR